MARTYRNPPTTEAPLREKDWHHWLKAPKWHRKLNYRRFRRASSQLCTKMVNERWSPGDIEQAVFPRVWEYREYYW